MANAQKIAAAPTLTDLLSDPARISALPRDVIAELRGQIARLDTLLLSRLLIGEHAEPGVNGDRLLTAPEAAQNSAPPKIGCIGTRTHCPLRCAWERSISGSARRE
jgi:hypothetical protein